jgi:hypothetical protein
MPAQKQNQSASTPKETVVPQPDAPSRPLRREPEKTLFSWKAPLRPFKRRDREFWVTVIVITVIFGVILFLIEGAMPVILIISVVFLFYVLSTVEPEEIEYGITNRGVKIVNKTTSWDFLTRYWFSKRYNSKLLIFEMTSIPGRLEVVIHEKDKNSLKKHLNKYVVEEEVPPSSLDKTANWLSKKFPGNK